MKIPSPYFIDNRNANYILLKYNCYKVLFCIKKSCFGHNILERQTNSNYAFKNVLQLSDITEVAIKSIWMVKRGIKFGLTWKEYIMSNSS